MTPKNSRLLKLTYSTPTIRTEFSAGKPIHLDTTDASFTIETFYIKVRGSGVGRAAFIAHAFPPILGPNMDEVPF